MLPHFFTQAGETTVIIKNSMRKDAFDGLIEAQVNWATTMLASLYNHSSEHRITKSTSPDPT